MSWQDRRDAWAAAVPLPDTNLPWLWDRTIFLTEHGSRAYGTNTATSDTDYKGVAIPPAKYHHGYLEQFHQAEFRKPNPDMAIYDLRKFFKLAADCNPSIIEVLFTDPRNHMITTPLGRRLLEIRQQFVSKKAKHTFSGYAVSQLKKIKSHYRWLKSPPKQPPTREEYGLPERTVIPADQLKAAQSMIRKQLDHWNVPVDELDDAAKVAVQERFVEALALIKTGYEADLVERLRLHAKAMRHEKATDYDYEQAQGIEDAIEIITQGQVNLERIAGNLLGFSDNFLELLDKERGYKNRMEEWRSYQSWLATRNPDRSKLEAQFGYDTKHGMHLVRLLRMGREILTTGEVIVYRPDRQELLEIRGGALSYEELLTYAELELANLEDLYTTTNMVPGAPDRVKLDQICQELVEESLR